MSRRQIIGALRSKGIIATRVQYDRQATPHGMVPGWTIELEEECQEQLAALGAEFEPDCETAAEAMEWVESLPSLTTIPAGDAQEAGR